MGGGVNKTTIDGREVDHAPNAKLKEVLNVAGLLPNVNGNIPADKMPTSSGKTFDGFNVRMPDGTIKYVQINPADGSFVDINDKEIPIPVGTTITSVFLAPGQKLLKYTIIDANGKKCTVPVIVSTNGGTTPTSAKWSEIEKAAKDAGVNLGPGPGGSAVTGWKYGSGDYSNGTDINASSDPDIPENYEIGPVLTAKYSINNGSSSSYPATFGNVTYPNAEKTLQQIFTEIFNANESAIKTTITQKNSSISSPTVNDFIEGKSTETTATRGFDGWVVRKPDGTEVIVKSSEIKNQSGAADVSTKYPAGTTIRPNWIPQLRLDRGDGTARDLGIEFTWFERGVIDSSTQIGDFYISNTEITIDQWKKVMSKNGEGTNWIQMDGATQWSGKKGTTGDSPMDKISWYDAIMFCNQLSRIYGRTLYYELEVTEDITNGSNVVAKGTYRGNDFFDAINKTGILYSKGDKPITSQWPYYNDLWEKVVVKITNDTSKPGFRLPTSDYWRYAAHGGKDNIYPTYSGTTGSSDNDLDYVAWYESNSGKKPHPVGTKGGDNPVRDMTGNVSEWCWDEYDGHTRLYIGGTYNANKNSQDIDAALDPGGKGDGAMFGPAEPANSSTDPHVKYHAGQAGNRDTQGMRIIIPGKPGDYNF